MKIKQSIPLTPTGGDMTASLADLAISAPANGGSHDALVHFVDLSEPNGLRKGPAPASRSIPTSWRARLPKPPRVLRAPVLLILLVATWLLLLSSTARWTVRFIPFQVVLIAYLATRLARVSVAAASKTRRATIPALAAAVPLAGYFVLFALPNSFPDAWFPRIDTQSLPVIDTALVGQPAHKYFQEYSTARDVVAWLLYGVMHFVSPVIVGGGALVWGLRVGPKMPGNAALPGPGGSTTRAWWKEGVARVVRTVRWVDMRAGMLKAYVVVFACCNLAGVMIQYLLPTAAPWYNDKYGTAEPDRHMHGDAAGLSRVDAILGAPVYTTVFANSPLVFGAFPSLHAAYAVLAAIFVGDQFPWLHFGKAPFPMAVLGTAYAAGMWWATMYFAHHYLIDLLGGGALAVACYVAARKRITEVRRALVEGGETRGIDG
ncbi:Aureobasidin resistance protein Aur1 [Allomyces arbusculus]|nr:Aureobasidin resistance protein Aur1 [Allomyces arbusculus]